MKHRFKTSGFTLIELLAVMAIIAILAAIIVPKIGGATNKAKQMSCATNMRNIVNAMKVYEDDYNEALCDGSSTTTLTLFGNLYYVNQATKTGVSSGISSMDIYACPGTTSVGPTHGNYKAALTLPAANDAIEYAIVVAGASTTNQPSAKTDPDQNAILIEKGLNHGGRNVARWDSKVFFVKSGGTVADYPSNITASTGAELTAAANEIYEASMRIDETGVNAAALLLT